MINYVIINYEKYYMYDITAINCTCQRFMIDSTILNFFMIFAFDYTLCIMMKIPHNIFFTNM